jgi:zinc/manganese transport system substrate-binding protein
MRKTTLPVFAALAFLGAPAHALRVVTTLEDFASLAKEVGGARVEASSLARGYQDPHFVDAKPSLVLQLSRAELLIVAGLDLESGYLPPLLDQSRNRNIRPGSPGYLDASVGCEILGRPTQAVTRAMGDVHPLGNPHYWTDPENGRRIARAIAAKLGALDPAGAADYQRNLDDFERRLDAKEKEWSALMAPHAGLEVITFHDSWPNFAKRFGIQVAGHVEPKPGIPPSPSHTLAIINLMKAQNIRLILVEPYFDTKTPKHIAGKTGAEVLTFYPSVGGVPEIRDYLSLFDYNLNALVKALTGTS